MPPTRKRENKAYSPGEIVFTKLKGYPWWPAKIEDDKNVPKAVLNIKKKKKNTQTNYTVFFFGSLDYQFFNESMIRPFNADQVRQDLSNDKFKSKALVEALHQALDPGFFKSIDKSTKVSKSKQRAKKEQQQQEQVVDNNPNKRPRKESAIDSSAKDTSRRYEQAKANSLRKRALEEDEDGGDDAEKNDRNSGHEQGPSVNSENKSNGKKRRRQSSPVSMDANVNEIELKEEDVTSAMTTVLDTQPERTSRHKSKGLDAASQKSPEYERSFKLLYSFRHKLQKLIYPKKPGDIPCNDYPKIDFILKAIEQSEMTRELLKETKIGKVVRYGMQYKFDQGDTYNLQKRCSNLLRTWEKSLVNSTCSNVGVSNSEGKTSLSSMMTNRINDCTVPGSQAKEQSHAMGNTTPPLSSLAIQKTTEAKATETSSIVSHDAITHDTISDRTASSPSTSQVAVFEEEQMDHPDAISSMSTVSKRKTIETVHDDTTFANKQQGEEDRPDLNDGQQQQIDAQNDSTNRVDGQISKEHTGISLGEDTTRAEKGSDTYDNESAEATNNMMDEDPEAEAEAEAEADKADNKLGSDTLPLSMNHVENDTASDIAIEKSPLENIFTNDTPLITQPMEEVNHHYSSSTIKVNIGEEMKGRHEIQNVMDHKSDNVILTMAPEKTISATLLEQQTDAIDATDARITAAATVEKVSTSDLSNTISNGMDSSTDISPTVLTTEQPVTLSQAVSRDQTRQ